MKNFTINMAAIVLPLLLVFTGCKKESFDSEIGLTKVSVTKEKKKSVVHEISIDLNTQYRVAVNPSPETVSPGVKTYNFFPGKGEGTATFLGNVTNYFNQAAYATAPFPNALPSGSNPAAVTDVPGYSVNTLLPLPFIQPNDFAGLPDVIKDLKVPATIDGNIINSIIYNSNGDAIFTSAIANTGGTGPYIFDGNNQLIKIGFYGEALICGGSGKFKHVTGKLNYSGYFSVVNPNDAKYIATGTFQFKDK